MAASEPEQAKLHRFIQWLQANGVDLRGSSIRHCGPNKGFGVFATAQPAGNHGNGVVMVVPLDLAITPMRVLQDPAFGTRCRALFEEGDVDDRFLVMIYLMVERLRPNSLWKPYLDMLPSTFGSTLWFTEVELSELKGTTLYQATVIQRKKLQALYDDKVKGLVEELLHCDGELESVTEVRFEDFLWANSIFWTRALNIPFPHSFVFPDSLRGKDNDAMCQGSECGYPVTQNTGETSGHGHSAKKEDANIIVEKRNDEALKTQSEETIWVEGLVPGIDFCNHGLKAVATWEVDPTGKVTGIPASMYLMIVDQRTGEVGKEIHISYGNKGNEELLYLYGFVIENNPDDYLMVHYPIEALQSIPLSESKARLLDMQKAELRCLLPRNLLDHGFFSGSPLQNENNGEGHTSWLCNYSWSGQRKVPSYLNKLVFPQEFMTALRTIAMKEHELGLVASLIEELVGSGTERQPSDEEVQAAIWEACGDLGALELLIDLLRVKMMELEESSGTEASDMELLKRIHFEVEDSERNNKNSGDKLMNRNQWSSIVYRKGQKQLTSLFLREAEHALELCASEQS
ncbi:uncharacterized protein [Elaeis guineensis]|uniref:Uncharacterized protein LOC105059337 isoform X2 n=1 Tax=Elaeis guineensis var. tenera TaxID=51953 RepID=A0A6I9SCV0_ELAGV|nr:uncharacterized protein LOC105059337 isoform X2 [Elaeis guineensis]XP_010940903.1 uncharacterized protein LOC105059337 isoform X2 [Elaeis guineensis]